MMKLQPEIKRISNGKGRSRKVKMAEDRNRACVAEPRRANGAGSAPEAVHNPLNSNPTVKPLLFWMPDGSCFEGTTAKLAPELMFIESRVQAPVGATITIRPAQPAPSVGDSWDVAEATVVWRCPSADHYQHRMGFGVRLRDSWSLQLESVRSHSPKEAG